MRKPDMGHRSEDQDLDNALLEVTRILLPGKVHELETTFREEAPPQCATILPFKRPTGNR